MNYTPTADQITAINKAIPDLEQALLGLPDEATNQDELREELDYAEKTARPTLLRHEALYGELLRAELAATPASDRLRHQYFTIVNPGELSELAIINIEPFLRMMLAAFYAFTSRDSDLIAGNEMKPALPPLNPPSA